MKPRLCRVIPALLWLVLILVPLDVFSSVDQGRVVRVIDGDTIVVLCQGKRIKIRLASIDCPEKKQAHGLKAAEFTARLVKDRLVTIEYRGRDRYFRAIAFIILPDGRCLNQELVRAGLAWWYRKYAPDDAVLRAVEAEARSKRVGLWADRLASPPWEFRKGKKVDLVRSGSEANPVSGGFANGASDVGF